MNYSKLKLLLGILFFFTSLAKGEEFDLEGSLTIDLMRGLIRGNICLSIAKMAPKKGFLLNRGLNIKRIYSSQMKDIKYEGYYNGKTYGEAVYYKPQKADITTAKKMCIEYVGAFPVYNNQETFYDFKGLIAFNNHYLRAADQSKWYPIWYDSKINYINTKVSYKIELSCPQCKTLYINGSKPVYAQHAQFSSMKPFPLTLFAGNFEFREKHSIIYINGSVSDLAADAISKTIDEINSYYSIIFNKKPVEKPVLLTFKQLFAYTGWNFVSWPTIAISNEINFDSILINQEDVTVDRIFYATLSHELAHAFFNKFKINHDNAYYWFYKESLIEYLSLKVQQKKYNSSYEERIKSNLKMARSFAKYLPLNSISEKSQLTTIYRYNIAPLLLIAMESFIDENILLASLREISYNRVQRPLNYTSFLQLLKTNGANQQALDLYEEKCLPDLANLEQCLFQCHLPVSSLLMNMGTDNG